MLNGPKYKFTITEQERIAPFEDTKHKYYKQRHTFPPKQVRSFELLCNDMHMHKRLPRGKKKENLRSFLFLSSGDLVVILYIL